MLEQIILIALVQGITEFLPISSSAHLDLLNMAGYYPAYETPGHKTALDVAVHIGTLIAVIAYARRDIILMGRAFFSNAQYIRQYRPIVMALIIATIPVVAAGYWLNSREDMLALLDNIAIIAWATLIGAILLALADRRMGNRQFATITPIDGLIAGLAQTFALIPGVSRSGITMTAARLMGLRRGDAVRLSIIMSIPVIAGAGVLKARDMVADASPEFWGVMTLAALLSMFIAFIAIRIMMAVVERIGFMPFILYRIALAGVLLWVVYFGWPL